MHQLPRVTALAHDWLRDRIAPGATVIDATAGNGRDTEFLARLVGPEGRVVAYDIQVEAIRRTRERLVAAGLAERVELRRESHERLGEVGDFDAVMFNLGYCPGGDKEIVTVPGSTLRALAASVQGLRPGGLVTVVCYPGHPGGAGEAGEVVAWVRGLDPGMFRALRCEPLVQAAPAPFLVAIERVGAPFGADRH